MWPFNTGATKLQESIRTTRFELQDQSQRLRTLEERISKGQVLDEEVRTPIRHSPYLYQSLSIMVIPIHNDSTKTNAEIRLSLPSEQSMTPSKSIPEMDLRQEERRLEQVDDALDALDEEIRYLDTQVRGGPARGGTRPSLREGWERAWNLMTDLTAGQCHVARWSAWLPRCRLSRRRP